MKILILSNSHPYQTAGIVAKDLLDSLNKSENITAKLLVRIWDKYKENDIIPYESVINHSLKWLKCKFNSLLRIIGKPKKMQNCNPDYALQDYNQAITYNTTERILKKVGFVPDVIIVLFMQNFLSFKNLYELNNITNAPILLYMMDMAPMTGGCHYAWDCIGYTKECGSCPALNSQNQADQTRVNYEFKKMYIEKTNIFPIVGSEWQLEQLSKSSLFKDKKKFKVLLSINENQYTPSDKIKARKELSLPNDKKIIFFGANSIDSRRKGFSYLMDALTILSRKGDDFSKIHLAIAGQNSADFNNLPPFSYTLLGYLDHNNLPKAFQAADVYVSPSIEDSGPMMVNQSIMSGTPVVAFEMGIAIDLVQTGQTGYLAKLKDSNDFANGIKYILELEEMEYKKMSSNCREKGLNLCHSNKIVSDLIEIYKNQLVVIK